MSARRRSPRRWSIQGASSGWGSTLTKMGLYTLTLAMLIAFWGQLSEGAAGCYSQVSGSGPPGLLPPEQARTPEPDNDLPVGVIPVRVQMSPGPRKSPKD
jgi:hypothetical protein